MKIIACIGGLLLGEVGVEALDAVGINARGGMISGDDDEAPARALNFLQKKHHTATQTIVPTEEMKTDVAKQSDNPNAGDTVEWFTSPAADTHEANPGPGAAEAMKIDVAKQSDNPNAGDTVEWCTYPAADTHEVNPGPGAAEAMNTDVAKQSDNPNAGDRAEWLPSPVARPGAAEARAAAHGQDRG
eukprot:g16300.t1